ncbi:MAG: HesA/MoeB/ThiF family protein [Bacteroidales bacterium]|jgi:adenylyltransferase/sulfurtransferase|nr:HesA/MoeB/ThiF family protein [Bacteroidales bacterium]
MLTANEIERYQRQIILPQFGEEAQEKLKTASVLIVGVGGLGSVASLYLVAAGVGKVGLVDNDVVSLTNLQRQILYRENEIGKGKTGLAKETLNRLNSNVKIEIYPCMLTKENADVIFKDFDIIIDCTDNFKSRFIINDACVALGKPFVYGSISAYSGQVAVFNQNENAATYRCLFPCECQIADMENPNKGVMGVLPAITASIEVNEALKLITGVGKGLYNRLLLINIFNNEFQTLDIEPLRNRNNE